MNAYLPDTTHGQRVWLRVVDGVRDYPTDIIRWFARHALLMGKTKQEADSLATDLGDYVGSSIRETMTDNDMRRIAVLMGERCAKPKKSSDRFITRPFNSKMAFNTVMRLSNEWHTAVADGMGDHENTQFPEPWFPTDREGDLGFIPITEYVELFREGKKMRHCVATYADNITSGHAYIYSARVDGERMYTVEIVFNGNKVSLGQVRGKCNAIPSKSVTVTIKKWCNRNTKKFGKAVIDKYKKNQAENNLRIVSGFDDFDDDVPF